MSGLICLGLLAGASRAVGDVYIDQFTGDPGYYLYLAVGTEPGYTAFDSNEENGLGWVLGGHRRAELSLYEQPPLPPSRVVVSTLEWAMRLTIDSGNDGGANLLLRYAADGFNYGTYLEGLVAFEMPLRFSDLQSDLPVIFRVTSNGIVYENIQYMRNAGVYTWQFADFGTGVDWSDISEIEIYFDFERASVVDGTPILAGDISIGPITAVVPAPATLMLLAVGIGYIGVTRRNRRK